MAFPTERSRRVFLGPFPSEQIPGEPSSLRSVKTSVSLEDAFWDGLKESAAGETLPVSLSRRDRFRAARTICHPRFASSHSTFIARPSDEAGRDAAEDIFGTIAVFERHKRSLKYGTQDYRLNRCADRATCVANARMQRIVPLFVAWQVACGPLRPKSLWNSL
jgi:hypothetical protein